MTGLIDQGADPQNTSSVSNSSGLVSVIIPTHNRPELLKAAILSVLNQTYDGGIEIIVVNDAGVDVSELLKVFNTIRQDVTIVCIYNKSNLGTGAARNIGLDSAHGQYIAFLDDDDTYLPCHISILVNYLSNWPDMIAAFTLAKNLRGEVPHRVHIFNSFRLMVHNYISNLCLMHRRDEIRFDESMAILEDWEYLLKLSETGQIGCIPLVTAIIIPSNGRNKMSKSELYQAYQSIYRHHVCENEEVKNSRREVLRQLKS